MAQKNQKIGFKRSRGRKMFVLAGTIVVCILLVAGIFGVITYTTQQKLEQMQHPHPLSRLIFGINLHLDTPYDTFVTSQRFRTGLQNAKVQFVRLPIRTFGAPNVTAITAAQDIKAMGATPLVILKFSQPDPVGAALQVVQAMKGIFGNQPVYYEDGNERDLAGINAPAYTAEWNQVVPAVKQAEPNALIGGPVNFQANPTYIAYFVHNANPKPDMITWHWYTCNSSEPAETCIGNIAHFPGYVSATRQAIQANGDTVPPIMITEWNYAPDGGVPTDNKHNNPAFLTQWTTMALQQLTDPTNDISASSMYDVANVLPLADYNGNLTTQGEVFQQTYNRLFRRNTRPPASPTTLLPTNQYEVELALFQQLILPIDNKRASKVTEASK